MTGSTSTSITKYLFTWQGVQVLVLLIFIHMTGSTSTSITKYLFTWQGVQVLVLLNIYSHDREYKY